MGYPVDTAVCSSSVYVTVFWVMLLRANKAITMLNVNGDLQFQLPTKSIPMDRSTKSSA